MKKILIVLTVLTIFATCLTFAEKKKETPQPVVTVEQLIEQGKYQEAVDLGKNMQSQGNTTAGLLVNIGVAYYKMKDYQNALSYLEQAYAKASDPLSPDTQLQLQTLLFEATVYHEMNNDEKVLEAYQKALAIAPEDKQVLSNYGRLMETKDPQKALETYDKLVAIDPAFGYDAAVFAMDKSDNVRAEKYLNAAKSVNPEDEQILLALVKLYLKEKKFEEAVPVLEKVISVTSRDILKPKLLFFLASCQLEIKKPMEVIATCDKILEIRANDENALVLKAKAYREMKDLVNAAKSADAAIAVNPENEEANYIRAIVAIEQKDFKKAKPLCEKVANLTQNNDRKKEVQGYLKEMKGTK